MFAHLLRFAAAHLALLADAAAAGWARRREQSRRNSRYEREHLVRDRADFPGLGRPDAAPEGIRFVIVSGEVAAENGRATGVMAGKAMDSFDSIYPTHSAKAGD